MVRLAKRLKKEKVCMDIVNFGEDVSRPFDDALSGLGISGLAGG